MKSALTGEYPMQRFRLPTLRVITLFLVFHIAIILPTTAHDLVTPIFNQGMEYYGRQEYAAAVDYLGQVCDMSESHDQARYFLIYSLMAIQNYDLALKHAAVLESRNPGNTQYAGLKKHISDEILKHRTQIEQAEKKIGIHSEAILGDYDPSRVAVAPELPPPRELKPSAAAPKTDFEKAVDALDFEEYSSAKAILDRIISQKPDDVEALHYRGLVEFNQKNYSEARTWFEKALKQKPDKFETQFLYSDSFYRDGDMASAEKGFERALEIKKDIFAMQNLAQTQRKQGKLEAALKTYTEVTKLDPNIIEARTFLAEARLERGLLDQASDEINKILSAEPSNYYAHYVKARIMYYSGLYDAAIDSVNAALQSSPENETYLLFLALCMIKSFKISEAIEIAGFIISRNPDSFEARMILAECMTMNGSISSAEEHLQRAEKIRTAPELLKARARIALKKGELEEGKDLFRQYASQSSENGFAYLEFAAFLEECGDSKAAAEVYNNIKSDFPDTGFTDMAEARLGILNSSPPKKPPTPVVPEVPDKPKVTPGKARF